MYQKAPKSQKHQKHQKHKNATKQKHKTQISKQNQITRLKTSEWKKVTYSLICVFVFFCAREEKKIKNKKTKNLYNIMSLLNTNVPFKPLQVCMCVPA